MVQWRKERENREPWCLSEHTNVEIQEQIEESLLDCCRLCLSRGEGAELVDDQRVLWFSTGARFPLFNGIYRPRFSEASVLMQLVGRFRRTRTPMVLCVGPQGDQEGVRQVAKRKRLLPAGQSIGMAMDLTQDTFSKADPAGLVIEEVQDLAQLRAWVDVQTTGFSLPSWLAPTTFSILSSTLSGSETRRVRYYLGRVGGRPVATSMAVWSEHVVGVYCVTTLPEARRQGIGMAMTRAALRPAHQDGYEVGVLQSTPMAVSAYESLGMVQYGDFVNYAYVPWTMFPGLVLGGVVRSIRAAWRARFRRSPTHLHVGAVPTFSRLDGGPSPKSPVETTGPCTPH